MHVHVRAVYIRICILYDCQMKWVNSITLPQSESIIRNTSERYSASLCWELNTKVYIKGEKGFFRNPD